MDTKVIDENIITFPGGTALEPLKPKPVFAADGHCVMTLEQYVEEIGAAWRDSVTQILELTWSCADAKKDLSPTEITALLQELKIGRTTFWKLCEIGNDEKLGPYREDLPPCYTILYDLTRLSENRLKAAHEAGVICRGMKRRDLEKWLAVPGDKPAKPEELPGFARVVIRSDFPSSRRAALMARFRSVADEFPEIEIVGIRGGWKAVASAETA